MRNSIDLKPVLDGRADTDRAGSFFDDLFLQQAVGVLFIYVLLPVVGHVDKRRFKFHQRSDPFK